MNLLFCFFLFFPGFFIGELYERVVGLPIERLQKQRDALDCLFGRERLECKSHGQRTDAALKCSERGVFIERGENGSIRCDIFEIPLQLLELISDLFFEDDPP